MQVQQGFLVLAFVLCGCDATGHPEKGELINEWETNNRAFKIRVSEYEEKGGLLSGAYYTFETTAIDSDVWKEILTFRHDDQVGIPTDNVHFVDNKVGFVFIGWKCAVTKDGGFNWSVWDAVKDLPNWQCCNYGLIQHVSIEANGSGVMSLSPIRERRGEVVKLLTNNYGQKWTVEAKDV